MATVFITGANRGLGLEFARQYAVAGHRIIGACRDPSAATALRSLPTRTQEQVTAILLDVTDGSSVQRAAEQLHAEAIDLLINCAGVTGAPDQTIGMIDYANWARVLDVNTTGPLRVIEAFREQVARSDRKLIVTITSGMGSIGDNTSGGSVAYRCSKAAVNMVVKCAAVELARRHITCVVMNPGWVRTDMGGPQARLTPEESVKAMRWVIEGIRPTDSGNFFNYDGGLYRW